MIEISVIMPCYNVKEYVLRSMSSVLNQTFKNFELILVNDGSTDGSLEVLESIIDRRKVIISQPNKGVSSARNSGIKVAKGRYIAFLDADDTWHMNCLQKLLNGVESCPSAVLAYCGWQNVGLPGQRGRPYIPPDYQNSEKLKSLLTTCPWPIHAVLVHKWAILEAGGFDENLSNSEDYKLWLTIASNHEIVRVPKVLAYYHFHQGVQATKNIVSTVKTELDVKQEFLKKNPQAEKKLDANFIRRITYGQLLEKAYECYWARELVPARRIFRMVMKAGYGNLRDWKYMIPALLPISFHCRLISTLDKCRKSCP